MKTRWAVVLIVTALLQAATTQAQATNPPYLSQMPTVERVKAEIKGSDPLDTAARQMGAFWRLMGIIKALAGPRFQRNQSTADEIRLMLRYEDAWQRYQYKESLPPPEDRPKWYKLCTFYEADPGFLDDLFQRFFAAEFRIGYYRAIGKQPPSSLPPTQPTKARPPAGDNRSQPNAPGITEADAYFAMGFKLGKENKYTPAIEAYENAIALQPDSRTAGLAHKAIGMIYNTLERYQDAVPPLRESLRLDPNQHIVSKELGFAYYKLNQYSKALAALQQAIRVKPDYAEAHYILGCTYVSWDQKEKALQVYKTLLTIDKPQAQELYEKINKPASSQPANRGGSAPVGPQSSATGTPPQSAAVPNDDALELAALRAKAEEGDAASQLKLGNLYFGQQDKVNGLKWVLKSAERGHADAQNALGARTKDKDEARKWYAKAGEQGHRAAQNNLCTSYTKDLDIWNGVSKDSDKPVEPVTGSKTNVDAAFSWCGKAANQGSVNSQHRLGILYARGSADIKPNYEEAHFWLTIKSSGKDEFRDKVERHLTENQRTRVEQRAKDWKPKRTPPAAPPA